LRNRPDDFKVLGNPYESFDTKPYAMTVFENVSIASRQSGVRLAGWNVAGNPSAPAVLLIHGWRQGRFDSNVLTPAGMLHRHGFNVLLVDLRNHGRSTVVNGHAGFGTTEYRDVLGAWDWLVSEKGFAPGRIGVYGVSMGAVTTMIAMASEPRIAAVFVDSPFFDVRQLLEEQVANKKLPRFLARGSLRLGRLIVRDDLLSRNPQETFQRHAGRPIYMVHSTADKYIDVRHHQAYVDLAKRTAADSVFWLTEGAGHVHSEFMLPHEYERRLTDFFEKALIK
jgi:dipeptidyl aminopeptidase/acylaminoacyl peptidase